MKKIEKTKSADEAQSDCLRGAFERIVKVLSEAVICQVKESLLQESPQPQSSSSSEMDTYLTAKQVQTKLAVTAQTLWNWEQQGVLIPDRFNTRVRYKLTDILKMKNDGNDK